MRPVAGSNLTSHRIIFSRNWSMSCLCRETGECEETGGLDDVCMSHPFRACYTLEFAYTLSLLLVT